MISERGQQCKADESSTRRLWEQDGGVGFPTLCEGCLGENPYTRMSKDNFGGICRMCTRPFTIYKWRPNRGEGYRKTEICQICAKTKNICQTCILDLQFGLPSQLRDIIVARDDDETTGYIAPESDVNKEYQMQQQVALMADGLSNAQEELTDKIVSIARAAAIDRYNSRVKMIPSSLGKRVLDNVIEVNQYDETLENDYIVAPFVAEAKVDVPDTFKPFVDVSGIAKVVIPAVNNNNNNNNKSQKANQMPVDNNSNNNNNNNSNNTDNKNIPVKKFAPKPPSGPPPVWAFLPNDE